MYGKKTVCTVKSARITLPQVKDSDYISTALEGIYGKELTIYTVFCDENKTDVRCDLWLCPRH